MMQVDDEGERFGAIHHNSQNEQQIDQNRSNDSNFEVDFFFL